MNDAEHEAHGCMIYRGLTEQRQYAREKVEAEFEAMQARMRRMETALAFYADPFNHAIGTVKIDAGQRARAALTTGASL